MKALEARKLTEDAKAQIDVSKKMELVFEQIKKRAALGYEGALVEFSGKALSPVEIDAISRELRELGYRIGSMVGDGFYIYW